MHLLKTGSMYIQSVLSDCSYCISIAEKKQPDRLRSGWNDSYGIKNTVFWNPSLLQERRTYG